MIIIYEHWETPEPAIVMKANLVIVRQFKNIFVLKNRKTGETGKFKGKLQDLLHEQNTI